MARTAGRNNLTRMGANQTESNRVEGGAVRPGQKAARVPSVGFALFAAIRVKVVRSNFAGLLLVASSSTPGQPEGTT
jgi:hypothetical protein